MNKAKQDRISRRSFLVKGGALSVGIPGASISAFGQQADEQHTAEAGFLSDSSRLTPGA